MTGKLIFLGKISITVLILSILVYQAQLNFNLLYALFQNPKSAYCIELSYLIILVQSWRWYRLNAAQAIPASFSQTILPFYISASFNGFLPGSIGGDVYRFYYMAQKYPAYKYQGASSILVDRLSGLAGLFVMTTFLLPWCISLFKDTVIYYYLVIPILILALFLSLKVLFRIQKNRSSRPSTKHKTIDKLLVQINHISSALLVYKNAKIKLLESIGASIITQFLLLITLYLLMAIMKLPAPTLYVGILAFILAQIANLMPFTPGGIGIGEAAFVNVIVLFDPHSTAIPYATVFLALRLLTMLSYIPGTLLGMLGSNSWTNIKVSQP